MIKVTYLSPVYRRGSFSIFKAKVISPDAECSSGDIVFCSGNDIPNVYRIELSLYGKWKQKSDKATYSISGFIESLDESDNEMLIDYISSFEIVTEDEAKIIVSKWNSQAIKKLLGYKRNKEIDKDTMISLSEKVIRKHNLNELCKVFLPLDIDVRICKGLLNRFGSSSISLLKNNPYKLVQQEGISLDVADKIALSNGYINHSERDKAILLSSCKDYELETGSTCSPISKIYELVSSKDMSFRKMFDTLAKLTKEKQVSIVDDLIYRRCYYIAEDSIAKKVVELVSKPVNTKNIDFVHEFMLLKKKYKLVLNKEQKMAVINAFSNSIFIITGGPGTGKTSVLKAIDIIYKKYFNDDISYAAPTGKAAYRIKEVIKDAKSKTIHSWLNIKDTSKEPCSSFKEGLVIIDESSMIDINLAYHIMAAVKKGTRIGFVGDPDQLDSIAPGKFFNSLIESDVLSVTKLIKTYRQDSKLITDNASKINRMDSSLEFDNESFKFISSYNVSHSAKIIAELYSNAVNKYGVDEVLCLVPFKEKTQTSEKQLNKLLQDVVNPPSKDKSEIKYFDTCFREGDKVMYVGGNNEKITNGETGVVTKIEDNILYFKTTTGFYAYDYDSLCKLKLAYAITIHKSQGMEAKVVITTIQSFHSRLLNKSLLYTVVTRAKSSVTIVGESEALNKAIVTCNTNRYSLLSYRIRDRISADAA